VTALAARIVAIGVRGPGLPDWPTTEAVLAGRAAYAFAETPLPAPEALPATERRRAGRVVRLAMAAGLELTRQAAREPARLPVVFASSGGDGDNCDAICRTLASDSRALSPTRFHNSVHNAPAGYWSIAAAARVPTTTVCAFDASFGAGLLESLAQVASGGTEIGLIAYDLDYPEPLRQARSTLAPLAIALLLAPGLEGPGLARVSLSLGTGAATPLGHAELERLRGGIPAGAGLAILEPIARRTAATVRLEYLAPTSLIARVEPCP
jgi:hypothetical protein